MFSLVAVLAASNGRDAGSVCLTVDRRDDGSVCLTVDRRDGGSVCLTVDTLCL